MFIILCDETMLNNLACFHLNLIYFDKFFGSGGGGRVHKLLIKILVLIAQNNVLIRKVS